MNNFLKAKFSERTLKICIEGGFTCPNRDGKKGKGGCIFCSSKGSGDHLKCKAITGQVEDYLKSERSKRANRYIAYFQSFTNTYGTIFALPGAVNLSIDAEGEESNFAADNNAKYFSRYSGASFNRSWTYCTF